MKKLIFGCVLMIIGVIGGTGGLIAYSNLVHPGGWVSLFANPHERDYTDDDFFAIGFDDCTKVIKLSDLREGKLIVTEIENAKEKVDGKQ